MARKSRDPWRTLLLIALAVTAGNLGLLVSLWLWSEPPDLAPQVARADHGGGGAEGSPATQPRSPGDLQALDRLLAQRVADAARARGEDPARWEPDPQRRAAALAARDPAAPEAQQLVEAWLRALEALGVEGAAQPAPEVSPEGSSDSPPYQ